MKDFISGVQIKRLRVIPDERGRLMELLRCDDGLFQKFGQVYMTTVNAGVVKGWHYHEKQIDNMACVKGMVKLVLYDARADSPTHFDVNEIYMGVYQPILVQIPPFVYHGFKAIGGEEAIIVNIPTEPYNYDKPDEFRVDPYDDKVPYQWKLKEG